MGDAGYAHRLPARVERHEPRVGRGWWRRVREARHVRRRAAVHVAVLPLTDVYPPG